MRFELKKPCPHCPFLKKGGARLTPRRAKEIAGNALSPQGATFSCHQTTVEDVDGELVNDINTQHCAGALILSEKNGNATQMMRIAERLGLYDAAALMKNKAAVKSVFKDLEEMVRVNSRKGI